MGKGNMLIGICTLLLLSADAALSGTGSNLGTFGTHFSPAVLTGQVKDSSGKPISGAKLSTLAGHATTTDANGSYTLRLDAPGVYTVTAKSGDSSVSRQVEVTLGASTILDLQLGDGGAQCAIEILKAKIQANKKGPGYKAKVKGAFQLASDAHVDEGVVVTIGAGTYTETVTPIEKKTTWKYKRPKGGPGGIKKLAVKWDKKTNPKRNAKKFSFSTDVADIFDAPPNGPMDVTISLQLGSNECSTTISMSFKKGKLFFKPGK